MPDVTAIVSAYYAEQYLEGRIRNLQMQSLIPEIVVVCQKGSEEEEIALNMPLEYPITVIPTCGVPTIYKAWNMAIEKASGKYIINANCDDRFLYDALEDMAEALDLFPDRALVYGTSNVLDLKGKVIGAVGNRDGDFEKLKFDYFIGPMPMWRKSLHEEYGLFDETLQVAGDYEFWLRCARGGETFLRMPRIVGNYLRRPDSAEHRDPALAKRENLLVRERYAHA